MGDSKTFFFTFFEKNVSGKRYTVLFIDLISLTLNTTLNLNVKTNHNERSLSGFFLLNVIIDRVQVGQSG